MSVPVDSATGPEMRIVSVVVIGTKLASQLVLEPGLVLLQPCAQSAARRRGRCRPV